MRIVLCMSGGIDSTVTLYHLLELGHEVRCLGFAYGQRHGRELNAANEICLKKQIPYETILVPGLSGHLIGHFRDPITKPLVGSATIVPGRNLVFLSLAASYGMANACEAVAIGAHRGDWDYYPDCREPFLAAFDEVMLRGYGGAVSVCRPLIQLDKAQVIALGKELGVPFTKTWSCYRGMTEPCGQCGACIERAKVLGTHLNQGMTFAHVRHDKRAAKE